MPSILPLSKVLDRKLAAHLLRRCTYCPSKSNIDSFVGKTVSEAVDDLFIDSDYILDEPLDFETGQPFVNSGTEPVSNDNRLVEVIAGHWMNESLTDLSIKPKLTFWLHTTFTSDKKAGEPRAFFDHLELLRYFSLKNLKSCASQVTFDNSMLNYLNGRQNTRFNPNENYAREFLELFTIGKGPQTGPGNYTYYTEDDVVTAARLFSGFKTTDRILGGDPDYWNANIGIQTGRAQYAAHDQDDKTFSQAFDNTTIMAAIDEADMYRELSEFVALVFSKIETARNYSRKLYRYFVNNEITAEIESDIIDPIAQTLFDNNYEIIPCIKQLLKSEHFFDEDDLEIGDDQFGAIVKSPMEQLLHTISFFNIELPNPLTDSENHYHRWYNLTVNLTICQLAGMDVFRPDSVAGYPAYFQEPLYSENWFSGSTLIARYKLAEILISGQRILNGGNNGGVEFDIVDFVANQNVISDPANANTLVSDLTDYMLIQTPLADRFEYLLADVFLDNLSPINWQFEWQNYVNTGNDTAVRIPLEKLFKALISSQEYQLM